MMGMRTAAVQARIGTPPSPPPPKSTTAPSIPHLKNLLPPWSSTTTVSLIAVFSGSIITDDAKAFSIPKEEILSSLSEVEKLGSGVLDYSLPAFKFLLDGLKTTVQVTAPVVKTAGGEVVKLTSPILYNASTQAQQTLLKAGIDLTPLSSIAKTVIDAAKESLGIVKPIASETIESISEKDPSTIATSVGALVLAYLLFPPVWSTISFRFRGYKGNMSAAQTLDLVTTRDHLLIDIRSENDKNKTGIPLLPSNAANKLISLPLEELPSKIKSLVKNSKKVEAELVALKIAYLKKLNQGSSIVIMDSYCDTAKIMAKWLTAFGFKNVWVMTGGFSGGRGWSQSRLGTNSYNVASAEVLSPIPIRPRILKRLPEGGKR